MTPERWEKIKGIFEAALSIPPEDRAGFAERECAGDDVVHSEVARLLDEYERTRTFIDRPALYLSYSLASGEIISGRYRVVRPLGRGGMGEVYEVRDEMLNEAVALKTLRAELCDDPDFLKRFQTEIQLARKVTHPNVCRVFEVGVHEFAGSGRLPLYYFTMQLLEGETLSARIHRAGRLGSSEAFPLIVQMAEGLQAAHRAGVTHRDFKSGNVIVTPGGAVVTDFGLAGWAPKRGAAMAAASGTDKLEGTVAYMSPEQMGGGEITPASDIYSLGIVLFEMATGRLPYEDRHIIQSAMQRVRGDTPSARALAPDLDPRWEMSIRRCLEVEPGKRFRSAADVADVFRAQRWRPPRLYWTRRRYALAAVGTATAAALGGITWERSRRPYQPKAEALTWYERGVEALRSVTYEAARRDLEKAVSTDPRYAPAYADLAAAYSELDASEQAKEAMLRAVSLTQDERLSERDALRVKAIQYVIARDFDRAQPLFEELAALAPDREKAGAYVDLARLARNRDNLCSKPPVTTTGWSKRCCRRPFRWGGRIKPPKPSPWLSGDWRSPRAPATYITRSGSSWRSLWFTRIPERLHAPRKPPRAPSRWRLRTAWTRRPQSACWIWETHTHCAARRNPPSVITGRDWNSQCAAGRCLARRARSYRWAHFSFSMTGRRTFRRWSNRRSLF